jgi:hypothetical protein
VRFPFAGEESFTPTLVDGRLFHRSNGGFLTCFDLRHRLAAAGR